MVCHYEIVSAKKYYGKHSTGSVLLRNGFVLYHASTKEVKDFYKQITNNQIISKKV